MPLTAGNATRKDKATGANVRLQHRHFAFIAAVIARMPGSQERYEAAVTFAAALRHTNPNFDHARFMRAANAELIGILTDTGVSYPNGKST